MGKLNFISHNIFTDVSNLCASLLIHSGIVYMDCGILYLTPCYTATYNKGYLNTEHWLILSFTESSFSTRSKLKSSPSPRKLRAKELMLLNCGVGEDSGESLGLQGDPTGPSQRKSVLNIHWKGWCWSRNSHTLATWCEELTHWKRLWCWERLKAGGEGDDRGWDGWMASPTWWTWVWVNSRSWWWTGRPGMLRSMGSQRVGHDCVTELNWRGSLLNTSWLPRENYSCVLRISGP